MTRHMVIREERDWGDRKNWRCSCGALVHPSLWAAHKAEHEEAAA